MKEENKRENERLVSSIHSGMLIMRGRFASGNGKTEAPYHLLIPNFSIFLPGWRRRRAIKRARDI
jgi:hypothetical protein